MHAQSGNAPLLQVTAQPWKPKGLPKIFNPKATQPVLQETKAEM
jgi:hypothetical protein